MIIKTQAALQDDLVSFVQEAHSYDVPEVIFLPIQGGSLPYLQWIGANTRAPRTAGAGADSGTDGAGAARASGAVAASTGASAAASGDGAASSSGERDSEL